MGKLKIFPVYITCWSSSGAISNEKYLSSDSPSKHESKLIAIELALVEGSKKVY